MIWNIRKQKTTNQNIKKKKEFKESKDSVRSLWDNFKHTDIHIVGGGCWKEKRESKKSETYSKKIMTENFPYLVKEIDMQVQEEQSLKQGGCKEACSKTHHN